MIKKFSGEPVARSRQGGGRGSKSCREAENQSSTIIFRYPFPTGHCAVCNQHFIIFTRVRNFYCALNIFAQDLQPYEVKKVSCVQSRTPGRVWRSRRQCTGSPAGCFMIKGVSAGTQKEPVLPDKGVDLRESSHGVEVCVSHHHSVISMLISSASLFAYYETLNNVSIITNECSVKLFSYNDLKPALLRRY